MRYVSHMLAALCCLCFLSAFAPTTPAAFAAEDIAFMEAELITPVWSTDPLQVRLRMDEKQCRKAYGDQWEERCFVAMGISGQPVTGPALSGDKTGGAVPGGTWSWQDTNVLAFQPETPWQAKTALVVDLSRMTLPARVKMPSRTLKGATLPMAGQSAKGEVWIDPSVSGPRSVSFALRFTVPPGKDMEKKMELKSGDAALGIGKTQVVWGQDGVSCLVKTAITSLSDADALLSLTVRGLRPLAVTDGKVKLLNGDLVQSVTVPGKKQLFQVSSARLNLERTGTLAQEYQLALKTSLRVPAADVLKALKVVELPRVQNPEATVPFSWTSAPAIVESDLSRARPLSVELVSDPGESGEPLVVRVPAAPGSYVYCMLPAGFGPGGYVLSAPWTGVFQAQRPESAVGFLQPGNVLTLTPDGNNKLDIVSSGVDTVRWRATRIRSDSLNLLQMTTSPYARFRPYDTMDMMGTAVEGVISLSGVREGDLAPRFSTLDLSELMRGGTGFILVELMGLLDGKEVIDTWADARKRLVLATDLGMVAKLVPDGGRQVFVCSLSSGEPVKNAVVRILGANGQPVAEARTDETGRAVLPAVRGLSREKEPVALVASHTVQGAEAREDLAWMSLDDLERRVDYSRFPTQGQLSSPDNINAYVFGQRGIFRPGETLRFGLVVRRGDWKALPADMPLVATLNDPSGRVAMRRTFTVGEGLAELEWTSSELSPTGRYRLDVTTPASSDILGSGAVRVEEFQPDTLAIRAELRDGGQAGQPEQAAPRGWLVTSAQNGAENKAALAVYLRNFYGLPAGGRTIRAELSVRPAELRFPGFEDFTFPDMLPLGNEAQAATATQLQETRTTAEGQARVALPLAGYQNRTMFCRVLVEGFEADGGRAVTTEQTFLASPLPIMLGYRLSGAVNAMTYVPQGTSGGLEFVALDANLQPANPGQLHLSVAERRYVTVLSTDAQGRYVYEETPVDKEISGTTAMVDPATGRLEWVMPTTAPGEFLLTVRREDKIMARIPFTVAGNDDLRPAMNMNTADLQSTQLRLRLDKTDYAPGDTVNLFMAAPYEGVGLITLERDHVATHVWFKAGAGHSVHSLTIPRDFEGRGYINVTMGRAVTSPEIFMQPHSSAVAPITVNVAGRDMGLKLEAVREVLPGTTIKARLTARHAGKAVVFAVDEGVLQLTRFTTPDPLRYLLLDRALEVQTDQLFDLLMPVHAQIGKRLPAFGGDMFMGGGRFQNPFKRRSEPPLAWWSGVVDVNEQGTVVSIPVPAYTNGQVRIMAVSVSPDTAGATDTNLIVRAPLVLAPQLPLLTAPGDAFEGGVSLHNTTDKPLVVSLKTENIGLVVDKALPEQVEIPAGKELFLPLNCTAPATPGEASFTVLARTAEGQEFRRSATLSVRPPVLPRQVQQTGFSADGTFPNLHSARSLYPFMADATVSVSAAPLPPLRGLLRSLAAYPYDCVEQSISRAFPLVLLQRRPGMAAVLTPPTINGKPRTEAHALALERALSAIRSGFRSDQGMLPWPDAQKANILLTAYAGDYLLSLREAGLNIPGDLSTSYFVTLRDVLDVEAESLDMARQQAYGLWVLTRSGVITSQSLDALCGRLNENWEGWEKDVTATLIAGSYALMNMRDPARALMAQAQGDLLPGSASGPMNILAARALHTAVLARHFPEHLANDAGTLAARLLEDVNRAGGSTFEAALGARALLELAVPLTTAGSAAGAPDMNDVLAGAELLCTAYEPGFTPVAAAAQPQEPQTSDKRPRLLSLSAPGCTQFSLKGVGKAPLYWEMNTDGFDRLLPAKAESNGMEVTRVFTLPDGTPLGADATVPQGTVLRVELSARVFNQSGALTPVVLADLLPGGFELVLSHPADTLPVHEDTSVYTRMDRREDRIIAHTSAGSSPVSFVYHLRAVNRGHYALPAAYAEGLYDRSMNSHTAAGRIVVK